MSGPNANDRFNSDKSRTAPARAPFLIRIVLAIVVLIISSAAVTWRLGIGRAPRINDQSPPPAVVQFDRDIRPILVAKCFGCHGPDASKRKADLRLDVKQGLLGKTDADGVVVAPGNPADSKLWRRITADSVDERMPPAESSAPLSDADRTLIRRWIEQGAHWQEHWAFSPIDRPRPPDLKAVDGIKNDVDGFVLQTLAEQGLRPSPEADRVTLLRRLRFDLSGLPPSIEEVADFTADNSEQNYERTVDRLLASTQFGERMAMWWLDLVRYADSVGYHGDQAISVFPFRDYVIKSFNENTPFDRFTLEQLAGDLLPEGTTEQKIASGYNRLGMMTSEAGTNNQEFLAKYIAERVRNLGGAWLGVTIGCCECHEHKYDPFTSRDFYALEAFFADIKERGYYKEAYANGDWGPKLEMPTPVQRAQRERLAREIGAVRESIEARSSELIAGQQDWEKEKHVGIPVCVSEILSAPPEARSDKQRVELAAYFRTITPALADERAKLAALEAAQSEIESHVPSTLITATVPPRTIRLLPRGNWRDESGPVMMPAFPDVVPHSPASDRRLTRVELSQWLTSPQNPLTARVFVNRVWKLYFGAGLSRTLDDHGLQGDSPSHPQLLDWLAGQFIDSGWNVKHLVKLIVMSGTYRQSSETTDELRERDPENRWLARQGCFRLDAEMVRDNVLAVSGLLVDKVGGPSVKPYQPPGYWAYLNLPLREWQASPGGDRYRRSLYTHWQRQYLHPAMLAFDAPTREECTAERARSNTPLQSLVLMNDPEFVEAAVDLAERIVEHGAATTRERLNWAFRCALSRTPRESEAAVLVRLFESERENFRRRPSLADELLLIAGHPIPLGIDRAELAAWTSVCRTIFNLTETITRY
jgi:hypothetical protein